LAYYRLHQSHPPVYETATLRRFQDGRTDTIRLPNAASADFVEQFDKRSPQANAKQLRAAIEQHKDYSIQVCVLLPLVQFL
jgi:hypothetical protein